MKLYAQPYNIDATGFYFESLEEYDKHAKGLTDNYGQPVEEFEIQVIDGTDLECELAKAMGLSQCNLENYFILADYDEHEIEGYIIAVGEGGYSVSTDPSDIDIDVYEVGNRFDIWAELAEHFVDGGLFGDIPQAIAPYIDYDKIGRDLRRDYSETTVNGRTVIYKLW